MSLPSRERGLKYTSAQVSGNDVTVAPLAGAWIEIGFFFLLSGQQRVAPLAGAWIEIKNPSSNKYPSTVAPLAGAWIEIPPIRH